MEKHLANLKKLVFYFLMITSTGTKGQESAPLTIRQDSISFISQPSGYRMSGTFSCPAAERKYPAMILIWGSGPHTRDQVISHFPMFKIIADYFNQNGFAVLRIDKRSFGKSDGPDKGSEQKTTTAELADDIYSALQFLKKQPYVDTGHIGLLGHSEGAWIAEIVAGKDSSVKWLVLLGAPIINGGERQTGLMCANLLRLGAKQDIVDRVRPRIERYIDFVRSGSTDDSLYYAIGTDFLLAHGMEAKDITHKLIDQLIDGFRTSWWQYYFSHTPGDLISRIRIPECFIYGGMDENINLKTECIPMQEAIEKSGNKNVTTTILSGLDHFFEEKHGEKWGLSGRLLQSISCWLSARQ